MRHRVHELDGIRAVAVLAVFAFHTMPDRLPVGWVGVDVFFVLSGYLITGLLLAEREGAGRVRLRAFYVRRAARLYPALLAAVVLAVVVAGSTLTDGAVALAYLSDVVRWQGGDLGPLGHTWSLAIEEHFYVLWPLVVIAARTRTRVATAAGLLGGGSLAVVCWLAPPFGPLDEPTYNAPHARMWELLAGCLLACVLPGVRRQALTGWTLLGAGCTAAAALGVLAGGWPARTVALTVATVTASAGTIAVVAGGGLRGLAWWPLPQIGVISYGVYLYHFPIAQGVVLAGPRSVQTAAKLAVVLALAWASHRWVEEPIREAVARRLAGRRRVRTATTPRSEPTSTSA